MIFEVILSAIFLIFVVLVLIAGFFIVKKNRKITIDLANREKEARNKVYEIAILKELGERMGYSLKIQNIVEIIAGSLRQFIDYSTVSYMLLSPEKINFKVHLEKSVSGNFINEVKGKMLNSLSVLLDKDLSQTNIEEVFSGAILNNELNYGVGSMFHIPLIIAGKIEGLLTVADTQVNFYKEEEINILYKIANQAAAAVTRLEEVVKEEESKMNAMVSSMTEGVIMTDTDYRVLVANPAIRKALNLENKKDITIFDLIDKLNGKFDFRGKIEESVAMDKVFVSDEVLLENNYFKIVVSPVKNYGKTLGCVVIFHDITKEKEVEKVKEEFTSMIVHELRSPLDGIKKMIEFMRASEIKKAKQAECFQMIYHSSSDMLELVNNLLDMAKIEAGKFDLIKQKSDIRDVIKSRVMFYEVAARDAKVKISSFVASDVSTKVEFDSHTVSQVLNNLISNALKFNKENGIINIQVLMHKKGQSILKEAEALKIDWFIKSEMLDLPDSLFVAVTNSGAGIAKDQITKLFNKFVQVKTVFAKQGGTGLGLAITKSIIESHGGVVGAESTEGQGATFYFSLPL